VATSDAVFTDDAFSVLTEAHGLVRVVRAFGEIDIAHAKSLEKEVRSAFDSDAEAVLLDLGEVGFIDAIGLSVLLAAMTLSSAKGHGLRIVRLSSPVQRAIEVSGLKHAFPLVD
jgi:anti-anti-sigma factor